MNPTKVLVVRPPGYGTHHKLYVTEWTMWRDFCGSPDWQVFTFRSPISISSHILVDNRHRSRTSKLLFLGSPELSSCLYLTTKFAIFHLHVRLSGLGPWPFIFQSIWTALASQSKDKSLHSAENISFQFCASDEPQWFIFCIVTLTWLDFLNLLRWIRCKILSMYVGNTISQSII